MLVFIFWYIIPIVKVLQVIPQETTLPKLFSWLSYDEKKIWSTKQYSTFNWMLWDDFLLITHASRFVKGTSIFRKMKKGK